MARDVRSWLSLLAILLFSVLAVIGITTSLGPWQSWRPATCYPDRCFCEAIRNGSIRQPANAFSSLAFVLVAGMVFLAGLRDSRSSKSTSPMYGLAGYPLVFMVALTLIGFGSAFYHASLSFAGQFFDVMGMYLVASFVVLFAVGRIRQLSTGTVVASYVLANAALGYLLFAFPQARRYAFAVLLVIGILVERVARVRGPLPLDGRTLMAAIGIMAVAFGIWSLDITRVLCAPTSLVQGHAVWHVLGAVASWQLYRYYRSGATSRAI